jgi:hypothetical protein
MSHGFNPNEYNRVSLEQYMDERPQRLYPEEIQPDDTYIARLKPYHIRHDLFIVDSAATVPKLEKVEFEEYHALEIVLLGVKNVILREKFLTDDGILFDLKPPPHNIADMSIQEERGYFTDLDVIFGDLDQALLEAVNPSSTRTAIGSTAFHS